MLTELSLTNFRIFDDEVTVRFRPITILIGRNSSGKSSIIKFLLMLQQSLDLGRSQFLTSEGEKVDLGLFSDLRNSLTTKRNLMFRFACEDAVFGSESSISQYLFPNGTPVIHKYKYSAGASIAYRSQSRRNAAHFLVNEEFTGKGLALAVPSIMDDSRFWDKPLFPKSTDSEQIEVRKWIAQTAIIDKMSHQIGSLRHLLPVRGESERVIVTTSRPRDDVGQTGQFAIPHLQDIIQNNSEKYDFILPHLTNIVGISDVDFDNSSGYITRAIGINSNTGAKVPIADFGFGVGQCLPIIVQGAIMDPHTTLMVEQPEAQLHPTAQLELGSYFADLWKQRNVASIIETHSDNILLRLRRLIAKGDLSHEDVSVAYFTFNEDNHKMPIIKNLDIKEDGSMESGLPMEFFGADVIEGLQLGARA